MHEVPNKFLANGDEKKADQTKSNSSVYHLVTRDGLYNTRHLMNGWDLQYTSKLAIVLGHETEKRKPPFWPYTTGGYNPRI